VIKTIFVPASGTQTDDAVFAAALAVARPLAAHLDVYHQRLSVCEAAARTPHVQFCAGPALNGALADLEQRDDNLSAVARNHFEKFCAENAIAVGQTSAAMDDVSANWIEETDQAEQHFMFHARHSDLTVLGRRHSNDLMRYNLIEWLLLGSGRPILIAPESSSAQVTGTAIVGWRETPEVAHALAAALPLLERARRVVLLSVEESHAATLETLEHLAQRLKRHGIAAETRFLAGKSKSTAVQLAQQAAELHADLLVVGGYGHGPLREAVCGGVTRALIEHADVPVFMMH